MATTYTELKDEVQRWLDNNNPNLIAAIPEFIADAENEFQRMLHTLEMECRSKHPIVPLGTADEDRGVYALPADWSGHQLVARVGEEIVAVYLRKLPRLSDTNASNWLLDAHPDLYRYMSLAGAESWLKNDERIKVWATRAGTILQSVVTRDQDERHSGGPLVARGRAERPWAYRDRTDGRYEYLTQWEFEDLVNSDIAMPSRTHHIGWFTTSGRKLKVWPVPTTDPVGDVGWSVCP